MKLVYNVEDRPKFSQVLIFALQQMLAIMAATLVVPVLVNSYGQVNLNMDIAAALMGAGFGTLCYQLFTKGKSPVFLGSSFTFLGSMYSATVFGYFGIFVGAVLAGLVYVIIAAVIKLCGTKWIDKLMPPIIIGPTVAIIGLCLAGNAVGDLTKSSVTGEYNLVAILCGLIALGTVIACSVYGKKMARLIPFIIGILAGYAAALIFTLIGNATGNTNLQILTFDALKALDFGSVGGWIHVPDFTFLHIGESADFSALGNIAMLYMPVAFVVFAEHIADHKNLSSIINRDLVGKEPGLARTLLGDGVGSMVGAFFGGCPNTTYGESVGCIAISGNASLITITTAAIGCIILSFFAPFVAFVNSIPSCVMGGVCVALYGFIAVSGLRMFKHMDLDDNRNLFVVATILITGIGGLSLHFGAITITNVATALILGILVNTLTHKKA